MIEAEAITSTVFNVIAAVGIILVNKKILSVCNFHFLLTLLFLNFLTTGTVLSVLQTRGWFEARHLPPRDRWLIAFLALLTVLLNNASTEANSVGFYQITKLLIIPTVIGIERLNGIHRSYSTGVVLSILIASVGVAIATVSDFEVNARGTALAFLSVVATAQYQLWQSSKQHEHGLSAMQITHSVGFPQSVIGFFASLAFDVCFPSVKGLLLLRTGGIMEHTFQTRTDFLWIACCCCLAVMTNISTYGMLGKLSPVTYQVIGQVKTCLIVSLGYLFFDARAPTGWILVRFGGVAVAVSGAISYAVLKGREQKKACKDA